MRQRPADGKLRMFLAQLLMVSGTGIAPSLNSRSPREFDAGALPMLHAYRAAIQCERLRAEVFAGTALTAGFWRAAAVDRAAAPGPRACSARDMPSRRTDMACRAAPSGPRHRGHPQRQRRSSGSPMRIRAWADSGSAAERRLLLGAVRAHPADQLSRRRRMRATWCGCRHSSPGPMAAKRWA